MGFGSLDAHKVDFKNLHFSNFVLIYVRIVRFGTPLNQKFGKDVIAKDCKSRAHAPAMISDFGDL